MEDQFYGERSGTVRSFRSRTLEPRRSTVRANRRTDRYGGSPENRARFIVEVLNAMIDEAGSDCTGILRLIYFSPADCPPGVHAHGFSLAKNELIQSAVSRGRSRNK